MNESVGSSVTLLWIVIFIAVICGYMAYNVNYTKAFRMKNKVIDSINKYGDDCVNPARSNKCYSELVAYAKEIGYSPAKIKSCPKNSATVSSYGTSPRKVGNYLCAYKYGSGGEIGFKKSTKDPHYYVITTWIDIDIPLVQNTFVGYKVLSVSGSTKTIGNK